MASHYYESLSCYYTLASLNNRTLSFIALNMSFNPTALRKAKIAYNFGLSECNRVKYGFGNIIICHAKQKVFD